MNRIGWHFPPTGGGQAAGYNDPGMAHFSGTPLASLARETIQNSLDARIPKEQSVQISFELQKISNKNSLGRLELGKVIDQCLEAAHADPKAHRELTRAKEILNRPELTLLRIVDRHTTGLQGKHWDTLVKRQGTSVKKVQGAGGSFGIGKYAPFVVSPLRTVFYWSRFRRKGETIEQCQGKAVLMSHSDANGKETQGIGFYGLVNDCMHLSGPDIPEEIQKVESNQKENGTSLWIAGFSDDTGWQKRIAQSVIENFFCAIADGQLSVLIDPDTDMERQGLMEIKDNTLETWFEYLLRQQETKDDDDALSEAYAYWKILQSESSKEKQIENLGCCKLWIEVEDSLPSKVALIRKTGMLVTTRQKGLQRFPSMRPFAVVCRFDSETGNELLRDMENPQHNQFEPDRLPEEDQNRGKRALKQVVNWIREEIKAVATLSISDESSVISELAELLPDIEPDDAFGPDGNDDQDPYLSGAPVIRLKPRRKRIATTALDPNTHDEGVEGDGMDMGTEGGSRDGHGGGGNDDSDGLGEREGSDGAGARGGNSGRNAIVPIQDVRYLPVANEPHRFLISFTPMADASQVLIRISEMCDSTLIPRNDLMAITEDGSAELSEYFVELKAQERFKFVIIGAKPITGRAWLVQAITPQIQTAPDEGL